jgi:ferredoxin-NADP reductase
LLTDSGVVAALTAAHLALAFVRRHRSTGSSALSPFVLPSFAFAAAPWVWGSAVSLAAGMAAHVVWFAACEVLAPAVPKPAPSARRVPVAQPSGSRNSTAAAAPRPVAASGGGNGGFISTPVLAVLDEATDIKTFRLARPEGFTFTAGQFLPVRVSVNGKPHVRCYSISSSPDARGYLEISVRRQGLVSTMLHATLRTGSVLAINRPAGQFVYPAGDDRPLALLAGGIGITPLLSMLRFALSSDPTRPVTLLYSARDRKALAFLSELRVVAERHPQARIGITLSDDADAPAPWRAGHIDAALLRQYVPHPTHTVFCLCGPTPMMAAMEQMLQAEGVPADQIRSEHFATAMAAASLNTAAPVAPSPASTEDAEASGGLYRLTFATSGREGAAGAAQTLLEAAECEGIAIASSCRSGVCQACRTRLVDGDADCRSSVLDPADRAAGFILPCVTYASSDCVLEA